MSQSTPSRNPARRVFAWEYKDATHEEQRGDGDRSPNMLLLPTGQWAHRVFLVGSLVDIVDDPDSDNYVRGELQDPTGRFPIDAGQFQPRAIANMRRLDPPEFVAVTGKAVTFPGDSGPVPKVRVENITDIPEALYDSWVEDTANKTISRLTNFGDDSNEAAALAAERYGTDLEQYRDSAIEAVDDVQAIIREEMGDSDPDLDSPPTAPGVEQD